MFTPRKCLLLAAVLLCCPVGCGGTDEATLPSKGSVKATGEAHVDPPALREVLGWPEDDQTLSKRVQTLLKEQKISAALEEMKRIRDGYDQAGDGARYVRASIEILKLEYALGKPETMIEQANRIRLPKDLLGHTVLQLYRAHVYREYLQMYSWEIRQRTRIESETPKTAKQMTADELHEAADGFFHSVWRDRGQLGALTADAVQGFISASSYPRDIRKTLRDAVVYLWSTELLRTDRWRPEHGSSTHALPLDLLLREVVPKVDPIDGDIHPLHRVVWMLSEHEAWHREAGREEAALEAFLVRTEALHSAFTLPADRTAITSALEARLKEARFPWWTRGMAQLARFTQSGSGTNTLVATMELLNECLAYQDAMQTIGGPVCAEHKQQLLRPRLNVRGMSVDGAGKRSIAVDYQNLKTIHFRAWAFDLETHVVKQTDYNLYPGRHEVENQIMAQTPSHEWSVELPETKDLRTHRHWVVPPMSAKGTYLVMASPTNFESDDWKEDPNRGLFFTVSDLVIKNRNRDRGFDLQVVSGKTGEPLEGVRVRLYKQDWRHGHALVDTRRTNADGRLTYTQRHQSYFAIADQDGDKVIQLDGLNAYRRYSDSRRQHTLIYTDRSIYRPEQTVHWKVLAYAGDGKQGNFKPKTGRAMTIELVDSQGKRVQSTKVKTNAFGSAAGEFSIPSGRTLGRWRVRIAGSRNSRGGGIRVEEYKRPTFEASFLKAATTTRLNTRTEMVGEARYYFGLPVTEGSVKWRVTRSRIYPRWWSFYFGNIHHQPEETIATGTSKLDDAGQFKVAFTPKADPRLSSGKGRSVRYRYAISAEVTDEGGETRSATRTVNLGFVAVDATLDKEVGFFRAEQAARMTAKRTDLDGVPSPGTGRWRLMRVVQPDATPLPADIPVLSDGDSDRFRTPGDLLREPWNHGYSGPQTLWSQWPDGAEVTSGQLTHDAQGLGSIELGALKAGVYRLRYETKDAFGETFATHEDFAVAGKTNTLAVPVLFELEKSSLKPGDTARVWVHSGFDGQPLYLGRWKNHELQSSERIVGSRLVTIPIRKEDRGGFSLSLSFLRDHQSVELTRNVHVGWNNKQLKVSFETFRDTLRPGQKEVWTVKVEAAEAARASAEVLAYMYDRSLDLFAAHRPPSVGSSYLDNHGVASWAQTLRAARSVSVGAYQFPIANIEQTVPHPHVLNFFVNGLGIRGFGSGGGGFGRSAGMPMRHRSYRAAGQADVAMEEAPMDAAPPARAPSRSAPKRKKVAEKARLGGNKAGESLEHEDDMEASGDSQAEVSPRRNFAETAFFQPQLRTDSKGMVRIEFEVPDSVTSWNVYAHAVTRDLSYGVVKKTVKTVKDLMVRPYLPRFLREGDSAVLQIVVNNASDGDLAGTLDFDIIDPESGKSRLSDFGLTASTTRGVTFKTEKNKSARLSFPIKTPNDLGLVAVKATARTQNFSDGELRPVPLLPGRVHLAQSRFAVLKDAGRTEVKFDDLARNDDPSLINSSMVVTLDGQLFYGVLAALPYLVNYPYECTEQTLNRFLATGILSSLYAQYPAVARMAKSLSKRNTRLERFDGNDPNRKIALEETPWLNEAEGGGTADLEKVLDPRVAAAQRAASLKKLRKSQTAIGGFPWFPGGRPSPGMTLYLMHGFAKALEFGVEVPMDVSVRAWRYLKRHHIDTRIADILSKDRGGWYEVTTLNYILSRYPSADWYGGVIDDDLRRQMLDFSFKHWAQHSTYMKAYLALTLNAMDRRKDALLVWESVLDAAKETEDQGTFWAAEDRSWLWHNDRIESHAMALRATQELKPTEEKLDGMVLWLFLNKKLNHWKSTRATAEVIYALAHYLKATKQLGLTEETTVKVGDLEKTFVFEPDRFTGKKNQIVIPGEKVEAKAHSKVVFDKKSAGYQLASATWHFSTERMPDEARGDFLGVTRTWYRREKAGSEVTLQPLAEGATIAVGDEIEVHLSLTSKHRLQYVHLRDPRGAGFEPVSTTSRYKWDLGIGWYEEIRDSATNFFFEWLPHGEYTFKYRLRATTQGTFKAGPAVVQPVYAPEFVAYSSGSTLTIEAAKP